MKNIINRSIKAFSLAEMMVVMLIMTIILAASMPILSKRAKVKAAALANSSVGLTCQKTINSSLVIPSLASDIQSMSYTMVGGGGGGGYYGTYVGGGGGGGSSAILYDNNVQATAAGGNGGYTSIYKAQSGILTQGVITNLVAGKSFAVYAGGGGNGGRSGAGGAGGAGWYGGGSGGGLNISSSGLVAAGGGTTQAGTAGNAFHSGYSTNYGSDGANLTGGGTGGGGFGACPSCTVGEGLGTGQGGLASTSDCYGACAGGSGGYVMLLYTTKANTCFL